MVDAQVFLDANAIIYALDKTGNYYDQTVKIFQGLITNGVTLCTSHHVIEEVLYVAHKISGVNANDIVNEISNIPNLALIEPDATLAFADRYSALSDKYNMGINDALLLQLMLDAGITSMFSYDKKFVKSATNLGIYSVA